MRILVIDVGGTHIKVAGSWDRITHRIPSGPAMTAADAVQAVLALTKDWDYEAVSLGYPGPVKDNRPFREPINIAGGWITFDFQKAFAKPVKVINDAAMQALGSYAGGRMLFLGLGTGLGNAIVEDWHVEPLELAHLPYKKGLSYEEYIGDAGLARLGDERWEKHVHKICDLFRAALLCDGIVLGGGNARKLVHLPDAATRGSNENAIQGGVRLWERQAESTPLEFSDAKAAADAAHTGEMPVPAPTRKAATKRSGTKQSSARKAVRKKSAAKKSTVKKSAAKKSAVKKSRAKTGSHTKSATRKSAKSPARRSS